MAGEVEGSIELPEGNLTIGPEGRVRANVQARSIVVQGRVDGTLYGTRGVDLKSSAVLVGDIHTPRVSIEEGASLNSGVLVQKEIPLFTEGTKRPPRNASGIPTDRREGPQRKSG